MLDRYGKLFSDDAATVGDVQTLGADLVEPREAVASSANDVGTAKTALVAAGQELIDAQAALVEAVATASSVPSSSTTPATTTTTTLVPPATIERVQQAEDDLARTSEGITAATPLAEATAEYNSAALSLQIAWLRLYSDAGCLTDEQQAEAVELVAAYTTTLQTELQQLGYYDGPIDGIYGPATVDAVKRLQADSDLPETGFVDRATAAALDERLAELDLQAAAADLTHTASVQTVLSLTGFWNGPIDGVWTDELTDALRGVPGRARRRTHRRRRRGDAGRLPAGPRRVAGATGTDHDPRRADHDQTAGHHQRAGASPCDRPRADPHHHRPRRRRRDRRPRRLRRSARSSPTPTAATVYLFVPDAQGAPTCTDSCADAWPPLTVDDASQVTAGAGVDESLLDTIEHPEAGIQVTYNGWPLYVFAADSGPGSTKGQGQGGVWFVLDAAGNAVGDD